MSRELRFVLILLGSIFGFVVVAGIVAAIFLGSTAVHMGRSSTAAERHRIAARLIPIPQGYWVASATDFLGSSSARLKTDNSDTEIMVQSTTLPGATTSGGDSDAIAQGFFTKTMQLTAHAWCSKSLVFRTESLALKGRTYKLLTFSCPDPRSTMRFVYARFEGLSGSVVTMTVSGEASTLDEKAVREILAGVRGPA